MRSRVVPFIVVAALQLLVTFALYEDQAGIVDWSQENVGEVKAVAFEGTRRMYVGTKANVVAAINSRTGVPEWRTVLSPDDDVSHLVKTGGNVVSLSGAGKNVKMWRAADGALMWDNVVYSSASGAVVANKFVDLAEMSVSDEVLVLSMNTVSAVSVIDGSMAWSWSPSDDMTRLRNLYIDDKGLGHIIGTSPGGVVYGTFEIDANKESTGKVTVSSFPIGSIDAESLVVLDGPILAALTSDSTTIIAMNLITGVESKTSVSSLLPSAATAASLSRVGGQALALHTAEESVVLRVEGGKDAITLHSVKTFSGASYTFASPVAVASGSNADSSSSLAHGGGEGAHMFVAISSGAGGIGGGIALFDLFTGSQVSVGSSDRSAVVGGVVLSAVAGLSSTDRGVVTALYPFVFTRRDGTLSYRAVAVCADASTLMIAPSASSSSGGDAAAGEGLAKALWVREEGLADVVDVVFVELPPASAKADLAHVPSYSERLATDLEQLIALPSRVVEAMMSLVDSKGKEFVKGGLSEELSHHFGFRKLALAATGTGKLYGLRMETGATAWSKYLPSLLSPAHTPSSSTSLRVSMYVTRHAAVLDHHPEVMLLVETVSNAGGATSVVAQTLVWLDGTSGAVVRQQEVWPAAAGVGYSSPIEQVLLLGMEAGDHLKVVLTVDGDKQARLIPDTAEIRSEFEEHVLPSLHLYQIYASTGVLSGFKLVNPSIRSDPDSAAPSTPGVYGSEQLWNIVLSARERVVATARTPPNEIVSSQAHIKGDDGVLLKYLNPNTIAIATLEISGSENNDGSDTSLTTTSRSSSAAAAAAADGTALVVYILDTVAGRVLQRVRHEAARAPVHLTASENWVAYSYFNPKAQRTEMGSMALYAGMIDKNGLSPFTQPELPDTFSSFTAPAPVLLHQTFVLPRAVTALTPTVTAEGITQKHFLVGLGSDQLLSLDRRFIDPRRPIETATAEHKVEGLSQYRPHLPIVPTSVVSYNRTLHNIRDVYTAPAVLESTSLVLVVGLDLWYTRVTPSKTFDLLAPDFNHALLLLLVAAMVVGLLVVQRLVQQKRLNANWK